MALTKEDYERALGEYRKELARLVKHVHSNKHGMGLALDNGEGVPFGRLFDLSRDIGFLEGMLRTFAQNELLAEKAKLDRVRVK